jgi:Na+/H+-dicarboxylate symporter
VILLPQFLPVLITSEFYHTGLFDQHQSADLLKTYLPDNIFGALAADNFPAVVLFSSLLGILLQTIPDREALLKPLAVIRDLFKRLNKLVVLMIPYGIFALVAINVARLKSDDLIRIQGYFGLSLVAFVILSLAALLAVVSFTSLKPVDLWKIIQGAPGTHRQQHQSADRPANAGEQSSGDPASGDCFEAGTGRWGSGQLDG